MNSILNKLILACASFFSVFIVSAAVTAADPVVIGIVHREDFAYAKMMKNAFEMALEKVNNAGGVNGQPLQVAYSDDQGDPKVGEEAVRTLILEKKAVSWWLFEQQHTSNGICGGPIR